MGGEKGLTKVGCSPLTFLSFLRTLVSILDAPRRAMSFPPHPESQPISQHAQGLCNLNIPRQHIPGELQIPGGQPWGQMTQVAAVTEAVRTGAGGRAEACAI